MTRRFPRRPIPLLGVLSILLALVASPAASAATRSPASLDNIVVDPPAVEIAAYGGAYNFDIGFDLPDDVANGFVKGRKIGHCIENGIAETPTQNATLRTGVQGADLTLPAGSLAAEPGGRDRLQWLLLSSARSRVAMTGSVRDFEAASHQIAVWRLTSTPEGPAVVAGDPDAEARAKVLLADSATHASAAVAAPALVIVGGETCGQTTRTVRVTGAPLTDVTLTITQGQATFAGGGQSTSVTLGAGGTTHVGVTSTSIGAVRIAGAFTSHTLVQVDAGESQDFAYLEPRPATVDIALTFTECPVTPQAVTPQGVTPVPVTTVAGTVTTRLVLSKLGPRRTLAGRTMVYRIGVRNTTDVAATNVRISDILPPGTSLVSGPAGARVVKGRLSWTVGTLAPRAARGYRVVLRVDRGVRTPRCNNAVASAGNAPSVRARVCTAVVAGAVTIPAVTG